MDINDILLKRNEIIAQMKAVLDKVEAEDRDLNSAEQESYEAMDADQSTLKKRADRLHNAAELNEGLTINQSVSSRLNVDQENIKNVFASKEYKGAFNIYARTGKAGLSHDILNALQVGTDSEGGYITPEEFDTTLVEVLQDINEVRKFVTVISTSSDRNIPIESSLGVAAWTAEEASFNESDAAFGQAVLGAHKLTTIIKVSEELLADAFFDVSGYLARNFGKRFGIAEEAAFINGDGSGKPTGIVPGSGLGVTAAGAAAITTDELLDLYHSVPRMYRKKAVFLLSDLTIKAIRKLKDGDSQYMWQPGLQAGQPDLLLGRPVIDSSAMPAMTTGLKSVVFGDLSGYVVADRSSAVVQRLIELYAANGQIGFRGFKRMDGKVVDATGIKHLIQA